MCWTIFNLSCLYAHANDSPNYMFPVQTTHLWAPAASSSAGCHLINFKCSEVNSCYFLLHFPPPPKTCPCSVPSTSANHTTLHPSVEIRNTEVVLQLLSVPNPTSNLCSSPKFLPSKYTAQKFSLFTHMPCHHPHSSLPHPFSGICLPFSHLGLFQLILHPITRSTFKMEVILSHFSA